MILLWMEAFWDFLSGQPGFSIHVLTEIHLYQKSFGEVFTHHLPRKPGTFFCIGIIGWFGGIRMENPIQQEVVKSRFTSIYTTQDINLMGVPWTGLIPAPIGAFDERDICIRWFGDGQKLLLYHWNWDSRFNWDVCSIDSSHIPMNIWQKNHNENHETTRNHNKMESILTIRKKIEEMRSNIGQLGFYIWNHILSIS